MALIKKISINLIHVNKILNLNQFKPVIFSPTQLNKHYSTTQIKEDAEIDEFLNDKEYLHLKSEFIKPTVHDQRVFVIQPFIRRQTIDSTPDLMLGKKISFSNYFKHLKILNLICSNLY